MELLSMQFFTALGTIILLDILLGGDNAVVIAMAANKLSPALRKKAILIGTAGAVIIRLIMTFIAVWLLTIPYLQVIGGLILLPIAVKLLVPEEHHDDVKASDNLMGAIKTIIIADAAMGVDNVWQSPVLPRQLPLSRYRLFSQYPHHRRRQYHHRPPHGPLPGHPLRRCRPPRLDGRFDDRPRQNPGPHDRVLRRCLGSLGHPDLPAVGVIAVGLVLSRSVTAKAQG